MRAVATFLMVVTLGPVLVLASCDYGADTPGGSITPGTRPGVVDAGDAGEGGCAEKGASAGGTSAGTIVPNHANSPHLLSIPAADFTNPTDKQYALSSGGIPHSHTLDFTAAELTGIRNGEKVAKVSSPDPDGNTHEVSPVCNK